MAKMTSLSLAALAIGLVAAAPASAQVASVAVADPTDVISRTKAVNAAWQQINTTYKSQFDQIAARQTALNAQLKPLIPAIDANKDTRLTQDEFDAAVAAKNPSALQWVNLQQAADNDIAVLAAPIERARAYAVEMVASAYQPAVTKVATDKKIGLIINPQVVVFGTDASDVTNAIAAEIDKTTPTVSIAAPATWQAQAQTIDLERSVGRILDARAAQARAAGGAGGAGGAPKPGDSGR